MIIIISLSFSNLPGLVCKHFLQKVCGPRHRIFPDLLFFLTNLVKESRDNDDHCLFLSCANGVIVLMLFLP